MEYVNLELSHYNHKIGINFWHLTWQTKYHYMMFAKFEYKNLCEASIRKAAFRHDIKVHVINVQPEHVHTLVTLPKGMTDEIAFHRLKGGSANSFFKHHPKTRLRSPQGDILWNRGGTAVTVGYNQLSDTVRYIVNQDKHSCLA